MENELASQLNLLSLFRPSAIFASLVFGVIGIYLFRYGKKAANFKLIAMSVLLMVFTMFTTHWMLDWGIGIVFCGISYLMVRETHRTG